MRKEDFSRRDFYDVWVPELAPSAPLASWAMSTTFTDARWAQFRRRYLAEMKRPAAVHLIGLLAALSASANFSVGCYCENPSRCHRSLLRRLLADAGATLVD